MFARLTNGTIEYAPRVFFGPSGTIINFNTNEELMRAHNFKKVVDMIPQYDTKTHHIEFSKYLETNDTIEVHYNIILNSNENTKDLDTRVDTMEIDINDNIFPYIMEVEFMVLDLALQLSLPMEVFTKRYMKGGITMTSRQALERLILGGKLTLEQALDRIMKYRQLNKITDEDVLALTDLAHENL